MRMYVQNRRKGGEEFRLQWIAEREAGYFHRLAMCFLSSCLQVLEIVPKTLIWGSGVRIPSGAPVKSISYV